MTDSPQLTAQQVGAAEEARTFLADAGSNALLFLEGLRGQGKTTIACEAARILGYERHEIHPEVTESETFAERFAPDGQHVAVFEENYSTASFRSALERTRGLVQGLVVLSAPVTSQSSQMTSWAQGAGFQTHSITAPVLSKAEVAETASRLRADISEDEIERVLEYSLGLPLLVFAMLQPHQSLDEQQLRIMLAQHLLQQEPSVRSYPRPKVFDLLNKAARRSTARDLPDSLRSESLLVEQNTPLSTAHLGRIPHGIPRCTETVGRYQQWMNNHSSDRNIHFTVFVPELTKEHHERLLGDLGIHSCGDLSYEGRIRNASAGSIIRKFHVLLGEREYRLITGTGHIEIGSDFLHSYLSNNNAGSSFMKWSDAHPKITIPEENFPMFIYCLGHEVTYQVPVGLAIESELQFQGLPYQVNLGGSQFEQYSPETNSLTPLDWKLPYEWLSEYRPQ